MILVSGLVNIETNLKVKEFPIPYFPIDYPFFQIESAVAGVGMNIVKALSTLDDEVCLVSLIGKDEEGNRIRKTFETEQIDTTYLKSTLKATPLTVVLFDDTGKREIYCDLKDIQDQVLHIENVDQVLKGCEVAIICNSNYNRELLKEAKALGKLVATDVHVLEDIKDTYNQAFMENADILFLSDEKIPDKPKVFIEALSKAYPNQIIVLGRGSKGAMMYVRAEKKLYQVEAVNVRQVVNTVGAGDALFSAFLHYYIKGIQPIEALKRAQVFAAYKIGESGAAQGFATEEVVNSLLENINFKISIFTIE